MAGAQKALASLTREWEITYLSVLGSAQAQAGCRVQVSGLLFDESPCGEQDVSYVPESLRPGVLRVLSKPRCDG